ncbi:aminotransferase [Corynebacterium phocae]|uniref:Histidinol-phosphate aminotransferase n=1 Tax=Corynebacterium phocae TaxID=161895 RepID=A0A1L7D696_9CORY|nr:histidinol-phosphate transaminase [Corynebacterium phocae]APT93513.1 aminotransferase [Corynebacterium phocae]KAA8720593.1 histidinol-phosphate transaminase [Corynebacterium phocae]
MFRDDLDLLPTYIPGAVDENAVKLSSNESAHPPLPEVVTAMQDAAACANRYPDMSVSKLRQVLADHLGYSPEQVLVGNGSTTVCQQLAQVTCQPGDEVIFPWRSFEAYPIFALMVGARPVPVPLDADHRVDLPAMAAAVTDKTKLVFVCNPNNPTGTTVTTEEFAAFMDQIPANVLVALDEAYFEYNRAADSPVSTEVMKKYPNVIGVRTFSKAYGLAGARVGYAFGDKDIIAAIARTSTPFNVNAIAQAGAIASIQSQRSLQSRIAETIVERDRLVAELADFGVPHSEANLVWIPRENLLAACLGTPQEVTKNLAAEGVLVRAFDEGIRITATTAQETDAFLRAWAAVTAV